MKITSQSELMKNHKHAQVMAPDSVFRAVQTSEGHSLLFSIGTDNVFYLIQETPADVAGWVKRDLSSALSQTKVKANTFDVALNHATGNIDIALAVTINGKDVLYLSQNNSSADATWGSPLSWVACTADDPDYPSVSIADVFLSQGRSTEYIVADILKDPSSTQKIVLRFFIDPSKKLSGKYWNRHDLAADLQAGTISSLLGRRAKDRIDGIYTMGNINGTEELIFTPLQNIFNPTVAPSPARMTMPPLASAMSLTANTDGSTNLFVAGDKALYFFASTNQKDQATGVKIVDNAVFAGVQNLYSEVVNATVYVWGLNQAGEIFYLKCTAGQETVTTAWSYPIPLLDGVEQITPYANVKTYHSIIFAHLSADDKLIQLTQDPLTAAWQQRSITLPATDVNDIIEFNTFSTHINVSNDDGTVSGKPVTLSLTSKSPVGIYVNNIYHKLSADVATDLDTDVTGALTILQETQVLGAVCYHVSNKDSGAFLDINPMTQVVAKASAITTNDQLDKVELDNGDGTTKKLLPDGTTTDQKTATVQALAQFATVSATLPADGSKKTASPAVQATAAAKFVPQANTIWGISYGSDAVTYHEGQAAMDHFGLSVHPVTNKLVLAAANVGASDDPILNAIETAAEDFFGWLKKAWDAVTDFFVHLVEDVYHFFIKLGDILYHFVMDCISVVVNAIEFVFNKIKVFFEDLIKWLGFLFSWDDILRTHSITKNILKQYAGYCISNIGSYKAQVIETFQNLEANINQWAGLPAPTLSTTDITSKGNNDVGQNSPQSRYGIYHTQHNVSNATSNGLKPSAGTGSILQDLLNMVDREGDAFKTAYNNILDIINNISTLSVLDVIKRIIAILVDLILTTMENIAVTFLDIAADIVQGALDLLDATIEIPVISWLYGVITKGSKLSILDLVCLVVAIPSTLIYKIATNTAPFPDDALSNGLSTAPDFATIQNLCAASVNTKSPAALHATAALGSSPLLDSGDIYDRIAFSANCMAFGGAILLSIVNGFKMYSSGGPDSVLLYSLAGILYLPYVSPDIMGSIKQLQKKEWYAEMNEVITVICTVKALVDISGYNKANGGFAAGWDKASPFIESALNFIWQVPTTAAVCYPENQNMSGFVNFLGGSFFDAGGIIAPIVAEDPEKLSQILAFAASVACNVGYGSCCLATNFIPSTE